MDTQVFETHMQMMHEREEMLAAQGIKIFRLSTTERQEFKECRRRWDFGSFSRQAIEPNRPAIALWFGTGIHHALEMYYSNTDLVVEPVGEKEVRYLMDCEPERAIVEHWKHWAAKEIARIENSQTVLWDEQRTELEESVKLGSGMLEGYVAWAQKEDSRDDTGFKEVLYTEKEFAVWVPDENGEPYHMVDGSGQVWEIWLVGRLDMVVKDFDDRIWVLDHKTSKDRLDADILILDDQMTMYLWAAQQILKVPLEGCYYNVLRKKLPKEPTMLKAGGLSKAKDQDTTYDVYMQAILDNGLDPADYEGILDILANKRTAFFERVKVRRNSHEIAMAGRMLLLEAIDMLNDPYIYPSPTRDCKWKCDYKDLCLAINRNDDVEYLKNALFRKREKEEGSVYDREHTNGED